MEKGKPNKDIMEKATPQAINWHWNYSQSFMQSMLEVSV
jgi:hypothetical protein